jgi:hypothetical protein
MKSFAGITLSALVCLASAHALADDAAEKTGWNWRFAPKAKSQWEMVVLKRAKVTTVKDMVQFSVDSKGVKKEKRIRPETVDQFSHRIRFKVEVLASDAAETQMRWTFKEITVLSERDGWMERQSKDIPATMKAEILQDAKKKRNQINLASQRFSKSLTGASFTCALSSNGQVRRMGGIAQWSKRLAAAAQASANGEFLLMADDAMLRPREIQQWIQDWTSGLPTAEVSAGQDWKFENKIIDISDLPAKVNVTRTLVSQDAGKAVVDENAPFDISTSTPEPDSPSILYTLTGRGSRKARLQVEAASGVPLRTSRSWEMKGNRRVVTTEGQIYQDESLTFKVDTEIALNPLPADRSGAVSTSKK